MRNTLMALAASTALITGCNTVRGAAADIESVANAFEPGRTYTVCGTYGLVDRNGDGRISRAEWLAYGPAVRPLCRCRGRQTYTITEAGRAELRRCPAIMLSDR